MRRAQIIVSALLLLLLLVACAPAAAPASPAPAPRLPAAAPAPVAAPAAPARPAWEDKWERTLTEAKKEGKVIMSTTLGAEARDSVVRGLKNAYGINVEAVGARPTQLTAKVLAERRAGLYLWDVSVSGTTSPFTDLEPAGALDSLDSALILPEVTDPEVIKKVWYRGHLWFVDSTHLVLATLMGPYPPLAINTNLVKPQEIRSYNDVLDPKWKGKMNINDPTSPGTTYPSFMIYTYGVDWLRKLAKQEPVIMIDPRLQGDWLAHGKVAIALGIKDSTYAEFKSIGAPVQVVVPTEGTWLSTGASAITLFNRAAHPNAARVLINWLLTKEAQTDLSKLCGNQSSRADIATDFLEPWQIRQPGGKYWEKETKELNLQKAEDLKLTKEIFGPLVK